MGFVRRVNAEVLRSLMFSYDNQQDKDMDVLVRRNFVRVTNCVGCVLFSLCKSKTYKLLSTAALNKPDKSHDAYRLKRVVSYETV